MQAHLKLKTEYSITKSTIKIKEGVKLAKEQGFKALAITDDGNLFGVLDFATECIKNKIFPIIGCTIKLKFNLEENIEITLYAKTEIGYQNLLFLTSSSLLREQEKWIIFFEDLQKNSADLIIFLPKPYKKLAEKLLHEGFKKEDLYVEISRYGSSPEELEMEEECLKMALELELPIIATNDSYFQTPEMFEAADILKCIGESRFQIEEDRIKFSLNHYIKSGKELSELFEDLPEAIENANNFKYKISFCPRDSKPLLPSFADDERKVMIELAKAGLETRIQNEEIIGIGNGYKKEDYEERLNYETEVISRMGFCGYFLIVADFINWSKKNGIPVGPGRGSGAGSVIAYALGITDVDPLYYGLLFERFLNPERVSMPDFDVDFCQEGREKVINYVKEKYGSESVAGIITFGRLQARAVLKDVGRVLQVPYIVTDKICKLIPFNAVEPVTLAKAITLDPELQKKREDDDMIRKLIDVALLLEGTIRHCSTHAAGIIIADRPLIKAVPLFTAEGDTLPAVGYHMKAAENAGLVKFDFLGLKTLTIIANTCKLVEKTQGTKINISKIPLKDEKTFALLQNGLTLGIFQLESMVCRDAMRKMKIDKLEDIIALTSLNRPGPMENIPSYINRKLGREFIAYPHPLLEDLLKETYGIIIYQEQVIKIAQVLAGYTLGQADLLRRAMGKKIKEEMEAQRKIFIEGSVKNGVEANKASEIFDLVEKFAGYGFNKSHAAAYSVISYQTAFLKAHFPVEFFVANLNMGISETDSLNLFINDARQMGIRVNLPSINESNALFSISQNNEEIVYGLGALKSVGVASMEEVVSIRNNEGKFKDIFDFCQKTGNKISNKKQLESLTKSGAFDCLQVNRRQILESTEILTSFAMGSSKEKSANAPSLFDGEELMVFNNPKLKEVESDYSSEEKLINEFEALGFYLSFHPLDKYKNILGIHGFTSFSALEENLDGEREKRFKMAGVVSIIRQRSGPKGRFAFLYMAGLEGIFEVAIFKEEIITKHRDLLVAGKVISVNVAASKQENGSIRIVVNEISNLEEQFEKFTETLNVSQNEIPRQIVKPLYKKENLCINVKNFNPQALREFAGDIAPFKSRDGLTYVYLQIEGSKILLTQKYSLPTELIEKISASFNLFEIKVA